MTPGNFNTTLGVVRTIREQLRPIHQVFICEMGAKNIGDIKEICDLVNPQYGVLTSIGPQHLESFKTIENIIQTKFELPDSLPENGIAFLNYDNEYIQKREIEKNKITYGLENSKADFHPYDTKVSREGSDFKIKLPDGTIQEFSTRLIGTHNVLNIAGAIAVAYSLGVPTKAIVSQVKKLEYIPHRLQLIKSNRGLIIDDAYNSNPSGCKAALETLSCFEGIKILVTPGMIELGEKQDELNKEFGIRASRVSDYVVLIGKNQTKAILEGLIQQDYPENKIFIAEKLEEGLQFVDTIKCEGKEKIILLENDLPDNY